VLLVFCSKRASAQEAPLELEGCCTRATFAGSNAPNFLKKISGRNISARKCDVASDASRRFACTPSSAASPVSWFVLEAVRYRGRGALTSEAAAALSNGYHIRTSRIRGVVSVACSACCSRVACVVAVGSKSQRLQWPSLDRATASFARSPGRFGGRSQRGDDKPPDGSIAARNFYSAGEFLREDETIAVCSGRQVLSRSIVRESGLGGQSVCPIDTHKLVRAWGQICPRLVRD
jgi:hypothetical protein